MKLRVTMKDPDAILDAIGDKRHNLIKQLIEEKQLTPAGAGAEAEELLENMREFVHSFAEWGEYITIEFDDVEKTATLVKM